MVCPQNRGDECTTSNKRILKLLQLRYSVFRLSPSFPFFSFLFFLSLREAFHADPLPSWIRGANVFLFFLSVHASFSRWQSRDRSVHARVHVVYLRLLEDGETKACMWVQCSRCDHPVVTDGVFPAGEPCVDANLRGGATYRYRSTFPVHPFCWWSR